MQASLPLKNLTMLARKTHITALVFLGVSCLSYAATTTTTKATKHHPPKHPETAHHTAHTGEKHSSSSKGGKHSNSSHHYAHKGKGRKRGQQAIDNQRATQIQQALVQEHYLKVAPSGTWDSSTQEAMRRYQADQGWQTKEVPDSRALIRLGLGPDKGHLLNPESAMTTDPQLPHGTPSTHAAAAPSTSNPDATQSGAPVATPATAAPDLSPSR